MSGRGKWTRGGQRVRRTVVLGVLLAALGACSEPAAGDGPGPGSAETGDPVGAAATDSGSPALPSAGADAATKPDAATPATGGQTGGAKDAGAKDAATASSSGTDHTTDAGSKADGGGTGGDASAPTGTTGGLGTDECVEDKSAPAAAPSRGGSGNGQVFFYAPTGNPFVRFRTKMLVPKPPTKKGILFLWPGLQPVMGGRNYSPVGLGVLQPVLTWGPSCAPNHLGESYDSYWISAQYVNTYGNTKGLMGCHGGESMKVAVGDVLDIDMSLSGKNWTQTVTDEQSGKSVSFTIDLMGQDQNQALFIIEDTYTSPSEDLIFLSSVITYTTPAAASCKAGSRGSNDVVVAPRPLKDGLECCIPRVVLRARGVAASSPD